MKDFKVEGMHCASCEQLIKMELEDAGFPLVEVSLKGTKISVPEEDLTQLEAIALAVMNAGDYRLADLASEMEE